MVKKLRDGSLGYTKYSSSAKTKKKEKKETFHDIYLSWSSLKIGVFSIKQLLRCNNKYIYKNL